MDFVAIGSVALRQVIDDIRPNDIDLIAHPSVESKFDNQFKVKKRICDKKTIYDGIEVEWARPGSSAEIILNSEPTATTKLIRLGPTPLASPSVLKSIMRAHLCFPIQWGKHINRYLNMDEYQIDDCIFNIRQLETAERVGYRPERYIKSNESFFKDSVNRTVPHDDLHEMFKFGVMPAFKLIKYDQDSAAIEIELFRDLSFSSQLEVIWEEALVLGWERVLSKRRADQERVAKRFLFGLATNYLPLEFRYFVVDNYKKLLDDFPHYKWETMVNEL